MNTIELSETERETYIQSLANETVIAERKGRIASYADCLQALDCSPGTFTKLRNENYPGQKHITVAQLDEIVKIWTKN